jgi:mono/diheme cytochrome c family protein
MNPDRKKGQTKHPREAHPPARSHAEDPEPSAASHSLPVWLFIVLALGLFSAMVYLDNHAGGFSPVVYKPYTSSNQLVTYVPLDPSQKDFFAGLKVYNRPTCVACHQASGMGTPGQFPPLAGSEWVNENDPSRMIRIVLDGVSGPIQVNGVAYNNAMLPWRDQLKDEEVAQVITYVRKAWGNKAPAVKPEQVAKIRQETSAHANKAWSAEELMKVELK